MKKNYSLFLCLFILSIFSSFSQDINFHHLTTDDGLSQISVTSLYEDERGFIWAGTRDGLNLYNGNSFRSFKHEMNSANSLLLNRIYQITGNGKGKIYIRSSQDVLEYDIVSEKFTLLLQNQVTAIFYYKNLYVGRDHTVLIENSEKNGFKPFYVLPNKLAKVTSIFIDKSTLYIGTSNMGLFVVKNNKLTNPIKNVEVLNVAEDSKGSVWISTAKNGLYQINKDEITHFVAEKGNPKSISSNIVRGSCEDEHGNIWVATFNGLNKYNKTTHEFTSYFASTNAERSTNTNSSVFAVIKDHQGAIWLGTYFGGISYFNTGHDIYKHYKSSNVEGKGLSFIVVGKMIEDNRKNIWIATEGGGLNMFNPTTGTFKWFIHNEDKNSIADNNIKALYYDLAAKILWIGSYLGGLDKFDFNTGRFTNYSLETNNPTTLSNKSIRDIIPYKNQLIVGTLEGVCLFNPQTGVCKQLFNDVKGGKMVTTITDLLLDHQGKLWISTSYNGIFSYSFEINELKNYRHNKAVDTSISYNDVNSMFEDSKHNLWICTAGSGLDVFHSEKGEFEHFNTSNSEFKSNTIFQVCESKNGELFVISNDGLMRFNYAKRKLENFDKSNGLPLSAIITSSLFLSSTGSWYLGGVQGLVSFQEKDLSNTSLNFKIYPSKLLINDKEVTVNDNTNILKTALFNSSKITLPSKYNAFTIEFACSNFAAINKSEFEYKLEGFSEDWKTTHGQHSINYTNLNPGRYTLIIKQKDLKEKTAPELRLEIEILPPFYRTIYAYLFYFILLIIIIYYIQKANNAKIKLQESLYYEQKRIQDVEQLNKGKLDFFTNISHEFRTPLTLIIGQMEMLLQLKSLTPVVYNKMLAVYKNGLQLGELITELLDFRKQEQGMMKIKVSEHDLVSFLYENYILFLEFANTKKVNFNFEREVEVLHVWFDAKQIQKVVNNLLSNAFKYTKQESKISLTVRKTDKYAIFELLDEGVGMSEAELPKIFDPFYQVEQSDLSGSVGTGIGLALTKSILELHHGAIHVESEKGKGTKFTCRLKLGKQHFATSEISDNSGFVSIENETIKVDADFKLDQLNEEGVTKTNHDKVMLVVEDNESLRNMLVSIFEPHYTVITAVDGEDGWEKVRLQQPHIVLSDIMMPKLYGTELCKRIKNDIETCHIPVVLLTARSTVEQNLEGLRIGADDYVTKPFNTSVLVTRCVNLINSRLVLQEKFSKQPQMQPNVLTTNALDKACMDKVMSIIEKYIADIDFDVDTFAKEMAMSRSALYTKIKGITGQSPNDFITTIRVKKSAYMLKNNMELNITEISELMGFNSSRWFSTCFKRQFHVSPQSYRRGLTADEEEGESELEQQTL